jgi:ubiquinone/menaquinone biosynthesis C-methylase UbiE
MGHSDKPNTIEGDWDRLYLEFPDVYDRFALSTTSGMAALCDWFDWTDKIVLDVGSGTGRSTFEFAKEARFVIGVEPWASMREFATAKARSQGTSNVAFMNAIAEAMPFQGQSVDFIVSIHAFPFGFFFEGGQSKPAEQFLADAFRIAKPGGYILIVNAAPGYFRPEVTAKAAGETRDAEMLLSLSGS